MQRLLNAARWDADEVRDALGRYLAAELGHPAGVLIADETGFDARGWQLMSCGNGSKGERLYDWAIAGAGSDGHHLLIRRSLTSGELAYYRCWSPAGAMLAELVKTAGARWAVEENEAGRQERDRPRSLPGP